MTLTEFFLHTFFGRVLLIIVFLVVSLLVASVAGWIPSLS